MITDLESIRAAGFSGFVSIRALRGNRLRDVPNEMGVYVVLRLTSGAPIFLEQSGAGHFKGKAPTVTVEELQRSWVLGTPVIYIGKAGEPAGGATLRSRLARYLAFGAGKPVGHYGGRLIWQLADAEDLVVCWKSTPTGDPRKVEQCLIEKFKGAHSAKRPFANLQD